MKSFTERSERKLFRKFRLRVFPVSLGELQETLLNPTDGVAGAPSKTLVQGEVKLRTLYTNELRYTIGVSRGKLVRKEYITTVKKA